MTNLAGFDLVIELARSAIEREILNTPLETGPQGEVIDTLVPPFTLKRSLPLPGMTGLVQFIVKKIHINALPRTSLISIRMIFEQSSIQVPGVSVAMLSGQFELTVPMHFTIPSNFPGNSNFALNFSSATTSLQLDNESKQRLSNQFGFGLTQATITALNAALGQIFYQQGLKTLDFSFTIDPSRDSNTMMTLTSVPNVLWIDSETLAFFCYHRHGANTGDILRKHDSDLPHPPFNGLPSWNPVVTLLSPDSFQRMMVCPSVTYAVRDHIVGPVRNRFIDEERARNNNSGPATMAEIEMANGRVNDFLNTPAAMAEISANTPSPCGRGALKQHINLPDPFPGTTVFMDYLSMSLGQGQIDIVAKAHAEIFCGEIEVTLPMWIKPTINYQNIIIGPVFKGEPHTNVEADFICEVAISILSSFILGPFFGSISTFVGVAIGEKIVETLLNKRLFSQNFPTIQIENNLASNIRWEELKIDPSALIIIGFWNGNLFNPKQFQPQIQLDRKINYTKSNTISPEEGTFEYDCIGPVGSGTFYYERQTWDTVIQIRTVAQDVPQPLTYGEWSFTLGKQRYKLQPGIIETAGEVIILTPPNKEHLETRTQIIIEVQGNNEDGWTLRFRGEDAIQNILFSTNVIDGSGYQWNLATNCRINGQTLVFDEDFYKYKTKCGEALADIMNRYKLMTDVPIWEQVQFITPEIYIHERIRAAVTSGQLGAGVAIRDLITNEPEIIKNIFR
ncbi:hypothetical protein LT343_27280 [Bacillus toyonensis]|uniref:hypothetical protein n=1 Tax=Bacillus toyonensis TaxID=155322 RepID=UPI001EE12B39|nr:hypothetical protein [Bacillus toyonensis]MCG3797003.1 hypothetical protein [Bacillus toyonensis]